MKSLSIPSFRSPGFRQLIDDRLAFYLAVQNYLEDERQKGLIAKSVVDFVRSLFGEKSSSDEVVKKVEQELQKRIASLGLESGQLLPELKLRRRQDDSAG